ncbi:armadillo-type protein [Kalaharituber pfeilii]|nr:armadillo-type protein [Kalaharituber pfeilii]
MLSLEAKLAKVRSPNQQNQKQVAVVLSAVEETLRDQGATEFTPTAYFAALLSLLPQSLSTTDIVDKDLAASIVYLLDLVTPHCPEPLLRAKFTQILINIAPALTNTDAEAPLLRPSIGCLESLLLAQDSAAWSIPQNDVGPRRALAGLLNLGLDDRPKVRKRAQEAVTKVLKTPPPSPSLDHPASENCAVATLQSVIDLAKNKNQKSGQHDPRLIHSIQLVHAVAAAGGWPSSKIEPLVNVLLNICRLSNEFLTMAAFNVFEAIFASVTDEATSAKLPRIIEAISELRPSQTDSQLLPPWLAVISRGYEVWAAVEPSQAFQRLPVLYELVSTFLESSAHNIRTSASQCLISLITNCIPDDAILGPDCDELTGIATLTTNLLSLRYQGAWSEVFETIIALFDRLRWKAHPVMGDIVHTVGDLRSNEGFQGKKEADVVLGHAVQAIGPEAFLQILPLNLNKPKQGQSGRAWLLPILRDYTENTNLSHFLTEMVPLSEVMFQRILDHGGAEKTMEIKIFETIIQQVWSTLPGYCTAPLDLAECFDQSFAELLANVLYKQTELRADICKALQLLVESNMAILEVELVNGKEDMLLQHRITKADAKKNLDLLASFASNLLAVLFNVYSQTLPQYRGFILECINAYLGIAPASDIMSTFSKVTTMLEGSLAESVTLSQAEREKGKKTPADNMPPMAHTLMDLVITISPYLPADSYTQLLAIFITIINKKDDPQLQKKAYKIISRIAESDSGKKALSSRVEDLQKVLLKSAETASAPARRDRLDAISHLIEYLPSYDLHFIPSILSEVVISAKEVNERARTAAFDLLVSMGEKMKQGGVVINSKVPGMPSDAPNANATIEEYFTMVSAGLAGSTPHMISASITALTRILYQFKDELQPDLINEMVTTMDLFLTSKNREIVRSVLGFVKVCIISLPKEMVLTKLPTLIPNLMVWSHEHKAHFKVKVKHMIERAIRRFGYDTIEKYVPEEDKKLVINIRKMRDRRKRRKESTDHAGEHEDADPRQKRKRRFTSEFEEAIYGSESDEESDASDVDMDGNRNARSGKRGKKGEQYIVEDEDEPLDLLDKKSLAHISSTKPQKLRANKLKTKAKTNDAGKLVFRDSEEEGADDDALGIGENKDIGDAVSAYVQAISGKHAIKRGQRNRVKFSSKRGLKDDDGDDDMEDADPDPRKGGAAPPKSPGKRDGHGMRSVRGGRVQKGRAGGGYRGRR